MARSILCLTIAGLNILLYSCLSLYSIYLLIILSIAYSIDYIDEDDGSVISVALLAVMIIILIIYAGMLTASVYLLLGVQRERHQYIAPWMYMDVIFLVLIAIALLDGDMEFDEYLVVHLVTLVVQAVSWYPIFSLYRGLYKSRHTQLPQSIGYTTCSPNMQGVYPPGAYAPQMQPAVYNPQIQPLYTSVSTSNCYSEPTACYPRQAMIAPSAPPAVYCDQTQPFYTSVVTSNYNAEPTADCYPLRAMAAPDDPPSYPELRKDMTLPPKC